MRHTGIAGKGYDINITYVKPTGVTGILNPLVQFVDNHPVEFLKTARLITSMNPRQNIGAYTKLGVVKRRFKKNLTF